MIARDAVLCFTMIPVKPICLSLLLATTLVMNAREMGGGGFSGGGFGRGEFRDPAPRFNDVDDDNVDLQREGRDQFEVQSGDRSANVDVHPNGNDTANVNVHTSTGHDYTATVAGPDGYRNGYIWQNGSYVAVSCPVFMPYAAPFGPWMGWSVVTQPVYLEYPCYATYPLETAVQIALRQLGLYNGPIDGLPVSCRSAIETYQSQNGLSVTGTINPELLTALGIQANKG